MMFHVEHSQSLPLPVPLDDARRLANELRVPLTEEGTELTRAYLELLSRWNATTSLIQARGWADVLRRHVAEGWLAARLLPPQLGLRLLDIGSGGGIPAFPLRAIRPDIRLTLLEPRQRKAAFLEAVARLHAERRPTVLATRLEDIAVEPTWDIVSFRGIRVEARQVAPLLAAAGRVLRFPGNPDEVRSTWLREGFLPVAWQPLPTPGLQVEAWEPAGD